MILERIICAAIWWDDGIERENLPLNIKTGYCVGGWRHGNCWNMITDRIAIDEWLKHKHTMGFLTSKGRFVNRVEGFAIAFKAGQVNEKLYDPEVLKWVGLPSDQAPILTSEDLY